MSWRDDLPAPRGRIAFDEPLAPYTWLRVGGPAEVLFIPADEDDLATMLAALPAEIEVTVLGAGSNVIVRDGGVRGLVVRLAGRGFGEVFADEEEGQLIAGAGVLDAALARASAKAGLGGLEFYAGIPGTVGGALTMNAGCYGRETAQALLVAWGVDRLGRRHGVPAEAMNFTYRHSDPPEGLIWTGAVFKGARAPRDEVASAISAITRRREETQPIRSKTGGSTFQNPPGHSAWKLIDEAGWRGQGIGGAIVSPLHANFLINADNATAADLEGLGERIRQDVAARAGVQLDWEIRRIGLP